MATHLTTRELLFLPFLVLSLPNDPGIKSTVPKIVVWAMMGENETGKTPLKLSLKLSVGNWMCIVC